MPRPSPRLAAPYLVALCVVAACSSDPVSPTGRLAPDAPSRLVSLNAYQGALIPLQYGNFINASGGVIGTALDAAGAPNDGAIAFYKAGVVTRLALPAGYTLLELPSLGDGDQIAVTGYGSQRFSALYYASPTTAAVAITGANDSQVEATNEGGVVVGEYRPSAGARLHPFRWTPSTGLVDITPPSAFVVVLKDISSDGYIVGGVNFATGFWPFQTIQDPVNYVWSPGRSSGVSMPITYTAVQALPGGGVLAHGHGGDVIWTASGVTTVGPAPGTMTVTRISANGRYVGYYTDPATGKSRAWTSIGTAAATVLPIPAGATASSATDVNACGTVLGSVTLSTGKSQTMVWSKPLSCDLPGTVSSF